MNNVDIETGNKLGTASPVVHTPRFRRLVYHKYLIYLTTILSSIIFILQLHIFKYQIHHAYKSEQEISTVTMLDIGQGDAFVINHFTGARMVIDIGAHANTFVSAFVHAGCCVINHHQVRKTIDILVLTHDDADHAGALPALSKEVSIRHIIASPYRYTYIEKFLLNNTESTKSKIIKTGAGAKIKMGSTTYDFIYPPIIDSNMYSENQSVYTQRSANEDSVLIQATINMVGILFTGDAGIETERKLLAGQSLSANPSLFTSTNTKNKINQIHMLKIGHHGSKHSSGQDFLNTIIPRIALISAGKKNIYGHPHKSVLNRLKKTGIADENIFRTDLCGTVTFTIYKMGAIGHPSCKSISTNNRRLD